MPQGAPPTDDAIQPPPELLEAWIRHPEIVKLGHPVLRQIAKPITLATQEIQELIGRMTRIMREAHGLGLAAPQVGVSLRLFIYDAGDKKGLRVLINPVIVSARDEQTDPPEGCLSIPGLQGVVKRSNQIRVKGYDGRLKPVTINATELEARVIQHEIDHLDGILFFDRADPETLVWVLGDENEDDDTDAALRE
jgi:peptide deformylase